MTPRPLHHCSHSVDHQHLASRNPVVTRKLFLKTSKTSIVLHNKSIRNQPAESNSAAEMKSYVILKFSLSWREQLSYIFLPVVFISEDVYPPFLNLFKSPLFGILVLNVAMFIYLFKFPLFGILVLKCGHFYIFVQIPPAWHSCFKMWPLFSSSPPLSFNLMPASDTREKETVFFENSKLQISSDKRSCRERRRIVPVVLLCQSWLFAAGQNWRK